MSSDRGLLAGLEAITGAELRYFELVGLRHHGLTEDQPVYFCISKHAFFTVLPNLSGLYQDEGGKVYFAHVEQVVEDNQTMTDLLIVLTTNRPSEWESERLFIVCHHRLRLLEHLAVAWQTDRIWRLGDVVSLSITQYALQSSDAVGLQVQPFEGYRKAHFQGYTFFLQNSYQEQQSSMQTPRAVGFTQATFGTELTIQVEESEALTQVRTAGREHIRWVAMERKQAILEPLQHAYILRNSFYFKRMNLANDIASWTGWEFLFKEETGVTAVVLLRREYMPPVLDLCQDIIITLKCPAGPLDNEELSVYDLWNEIHLIANSVSPECADCVSAAPLYFGFIQAKLNALHFDEEAMSWIHKRLLLEPVHRTEVMCFMKAVLRLLQDENALGNPSLLDELEDVELPELMGVPQRLAAWAEKEFPNLDASAMNAWNARVSRYLAFQLDGNVFDHRFTLVDLVTPHLLTEYGNRTVVELVHYLLHIRPADMSQPFQGMTLQQLSAESDPNSFIFNDRAMQGLIECGWVSKIFSKGSSGRHHQRPAMTPEYAKLLSQLLLNHSASRNLKAAICRQIIAANQGSIPVGMLIPALVELMERGSLFLQTYATVTLINITGGQQEAKALLMNFDAARICTSQLETKDDDLLYYTMVLLTNITKTEHHRDLVKGQGGVEVLMHLLVGYYHDITYKQRLLTELCSVIGQLCNEESIRAVMTAPGETTVDCLLHILVNAPTSSKLKSKVMFALKQVCVASTATKELVGFQGTTKIVDELRVLQKYHGKSAANLSPIQSPRSAPKPLTVTTSENDAVKLECATNALMLLLLLSSVPQNTAIMRHDGIEAVISDLLAWEFSETSGTRDRLNQLKQQISGLVKSAVPSQSRKVRNVRERGTASA
eukprot:CAMPEP_0178409132 /NCGR_PEP_ID=MMETSP0689_2-20121128/20305_1 /TAXON_ID=160604 /ORGANISM="Amphidinium massartii, Strain CS-259" /LENGTH=887 /DNA_ID=CAMNT_0020030265 /DNA_START=64 /DNA_END=2723 /DNA_ORIENTATION=-